MLASEATESEVPAGRSDNLDSMADDKDSQTTPSSSGGSGDPGRPPRETTTKGGGPKGKETR